jgi:signal transduction histidine kinase
MHLGLRIFTGVLLLLAQGAGVVLGDTPAERKSVLVIYENSRLLPATIEADRGFSEVFGKSGLPVEINAEFMGYPQFGGQSYTEAIIPYLRAKYQPRRPDAVVVAGSAALGFWLEHRDELLPNVPVVYLGVGKENLTKFVIPSDVYGVPVQYEPIATIDLALRLHPDVDKLVVITGSADFDGNWKSIIVDRSKLSDRIRDVTYLTGLPTDELLNKVRSIGKHTIIFTPGYFKDGAGRTFAPRDVARLITEASPVPVYGPFDTFIGTGVVGGRVPTFRDMGALAATIAIQLLSGKHPKDLHLPETMPFQTSLDWRQIEHWAVDPTLVPSDALVHFKEPGLWEQYRSIVIAAVGVIAVQSVLLVGLFLERRKRRGVEVIVDKHRFDLAHATRLAVAGQLTASIAHEINQPLGAIHSNIATVGLILQNGGAVHDITPILDDIRRDNIRASEVIQQLRAMIEKHEVERKPVDLARASADAVAILHGEALRRGVEVAFSLPSVPPEVIGDRVQFQQILINLLMNAMDAVASNPLGQRHVSLSLELRDAATLVIVSDNGHGIEPDKVESVFESFVSTKPNGIGLGLSIVRTLAEAHGGRVWSANRASSGASFFVELPLSRKIMAGEFA